MQLILIRHGQSQNNALPESRRVEDPGLTERGREQALHLGEHARELDLTRLFTSPFLRALQTTEPIWKTTSLIPEVRLELHEQGGCYRGHTVDNIEGRPGMNPHEIRKAFPGVVVKDDISEAGWWASKSYESRDEALERARSLWNRTVDEFGHTEERIAYVMHADLILLLLEHLRFNASRCPCNASLTKIAFVDGQPLLQSYNGTDHLPDTLLTQ